MNTDTTAYQQFKRNVDAILKSAGSVKGKMENNIAEIERKQCQMIKDAETQRDKTLTLIHELYAETASEIKTVCQSRIQHLSSQKGRIAGIINSLKKSLRHMERATDNGIGPNVFVQMQEMSECVSLCRLETDKIYTTKLSFSPAFEVKDLRSWCKKMGNVTEELIKVDGLKSLPEDMIPVLVVVGGECMKQLKFGSQQLRLSYVDAKLQVDKNDCEIVGIGIRNDGTLLIADAGNRKLNVISRESQLQSSLSLPFAPAAIAISRTKVAIATYSPNIYFVNIVDIYHMSLEKSVLKCEGSCITNLASYGEKLVVTTKGDPPSVKLIDKYGTVLWDVSVNQTEIFLGLKLSRELFQYPGAVVTRNVKDKTEVVVADSGKRTITLLEADKGGVTKIISTEKRPACVTTDTEGKIYVSYVGEKQIDVWKEDVNSCETVLSEKDLHLEPEFIIYDNTLHELLVCYSDSSRIDRFQVL